MAIFAPEEAVDLIWSGGKKENKGEIKRFKGRKEEGDEEEEEEEEEEEGKVGEE